MDVKAGTQGETTAAAALGRALEAEPLFHMSLGSKELFHSNLLAWFARKYPTAARDVFGQWTGNDAAGTEHRVAREEQQLDLVMELPGHRPLVIENKVFSLPDEGQLDRYTLGPVAKMKRRPSLVLLSLADPGWAGGVHRSPGGAWQYVGYGDLRSALVECIEIVRRRDRYDGDTVEHYCELVRLLLELKDLVAIVNDDDPIALPSDVAEGLAAARIADHAQKLRMHQIASRLRARLAAEGGDLDVDCGFTKGSPFMEAFVPLMARDTIGWQYQDGQFRLVLRLESLTGRGDDAKMVREKHARAHEAWFDFARFHTVLGTSDATTIPKRARVAADGFYHFDPTFVYRFREPPSMTVGQLLDVGAHYVKAARTFAATYSRK